MAAASSHRRERATAREKTKAERLPSDKTLAILPQRSAAVRARSRDTMWARDKGTSCRALPWRNRKRSGAPPASPPSPEAEGKIAAPKPERADDALAELAAKGRENTRGGPAIEALERAAELLRVNAASPSKRSSAWKRRCVAPTRARSTRASSPASRSRSPERTSSISGASIVPSRSSSKRTSSTPISRARSRLADASTPPSAICGRSRASTRSSSRPRLLPRAGDAPSSSSSWPQCASASAICRPPRRSSSRRCRWYPKRRRIGRAPRAAREFLRGAGLRRGAPTKADAALQRAGALFRELAQVCHGAAASATARSRGSDVRSA